MKGYVDDQFRALISLPVAETNSNNRTALTVWIDTAFNGGLVIPRRHIQNLGLIQESSTEAILADGQLVELETYACSFEWFGVMYEMQVVANDGEYPLLGTILLAGHRLEIDYVTKSVEIL